MKPSREGSDTILEFEFHLDLQEDRCNNVFIKIMENEDTKLEKKTTQEID